MCSQHVSACLHSSSAAASMTSPPMRRARTSRSAAEVLEHLEDTEAAVNVLAQIATPYLVVSVPREPLWRILNLARGAYLKDLGNTPGHVQHWSTASFLRLLEPALKLSIHERRCHGQWRCAG